MGGSGSCFPSLLVPGSPLLAPPSDLGFGISGDPLTGCVMQVGQLPSLSVFPPFSSLRGPGGWGEVTVMAGEVGEPAELGGPVQVTLLLKARVFGLTPLVLAWGQREGVRTSTWRGCPLEARPRSSSLSAHWGSCGLFPLATLRPLLRAPQSVLACSSRQASLPPCLADLMWDVLPPGAGARMPHSCGGDPMPVGPAVPTRARLPLPCN